MSSNYEGGGGRAPPDTQGMESLKVDNLTYRTTADDLRRAFEKYGEVGDVYIPRDRFTRESRGFGFVRFYDKRDAEDAMDAMDGYSFDGREIRVQTARYDRNNDGGYRGSRGGRGGGYGGGGGGRGGGYGDRHGGGGGGGYRGGNRRSRSRSRSPEARYRSRSRSASRSRSRSYSRSPNRRY